MEENAEGMDLGLCRDCKFYTNDEMIIDGIPYQNTYGVCRRYPPKRIDGSASGFPVVEDDWGCGEHQKKFDSSIK